VRRLLGVGLWALAFVASGCVAPVPQELPPTFSAWTPRSARRGIDLPPKNPLSAQDYQALDILKPGAVVVFSAQLGDPDPLHWIGEDPSLQR
jgi:hypothetical protein